MKTTLSIFILLFTYIFGNAQTVTDIDGNVYQTIKIGTQVWMKENLKTTKFNNGEKIQNVIKNSKWDSFTSPGYCWYDNDRAACGIAYGALNNWYAASDSNLCPIGWHVPSTDDWQTLYNYLDIKEAACKLKETGTGLWNCTDTIEGTNESGFTALPAGFRNYDGKFYGLGKSAGWWSATEYDEYIAICIQLFCNAMIDEIEDYKVRGHSVRCIKD